MNEFRVDEDEYLVRLIAFDLLSASWVELSAGLAAVDRAEVERFHEDLERRLAGQLQGILDTMGHGPRQRRVMAAVARVLREVIASARKAMADQRDAH
jgi:hypothetical protein